MALATTCPQCKTSFKVVPDQLKLRRGLVRCGSCQHVFSGIDHLRYVEEPRPGAAAAQAAPDPLHTAFFLPETILANPPPDGGAALGARGMQVPAEPGAPVARSTSITQDISVALGTPSAATPSAAALSAVAPSTAAPLSGTPPSAVPPFLAPLSAAPTTSSPLTSPASVGAATPPHDEDEAERAMRALEHAERSLELRGALETSSGAARIDTQHPAAIDTVAVDTGAVVATAIDATAIDAIAIDAIAIDSTAVDGTPLDGAPLDAAAKADDQTTTPPASDGATGTTNLLTAANTVPVASTRPASDGFISEREIDALAVPRQPTQQPGEEIESLLATTPRDFGDWPLEPAEIQDQDRSAGSTDGDDAASTIASADREGTDEPADTAIVDELARATSPFPDALGPMARPSIDELGPTTPPVVDEFGALTRPAVDEFSPTTGAALDEFAPTTRPAIDELASSTLPASDELSPSTTHPATEVDGTAAIAADDESLQAPDSSSPPTSDNETAAVRATSIDAATDAATDAAVEAPANTAANAATDATAEAPTQSAADAAPQTDAPQQAPTHSLPEWQREQPLDADDEAAGSTPASSRRTAKSSSQDPALRSGSAIADTTAELDDDESAIDYFSVGRRGIGFVDRHGPLTLLAAALLTVLLIAQLVVAQRAMIAARWPALAPALAAMVQPFGLTLELPRDLQALTIESFELQAAAAPGELNLSALLRNRAPYAVHWPAMQLTLTDPANQVLVRKVLLPDDYLPRGAQAGVPPRGEWPLRVALDAHDLQPAGYSVKLFYQ